MDFKSGQGLQIGAEQPLSNAECIYLMYFCFAIVSQTFNDLIKTGKVFLNTELYILLVFALHTAARLQQSKII